MLQGPQAAFPVAPEYRHESSSTGTTAGSVPAGAGRNGSQRRRKMVKMVARREIPGGVWNERTDGESGNYDINETHRKHGKRAIFEKYNNLHGT